jgi:hypothetical protein
MLTQAASAKAGEEWPYTVALIPLKYLFVDERYQRPRQEAFISKMAERFDPTLVGVIDVAQRGERFAILDGRQRLGMMEIVGKTAAWCAVYESMSLRDEAEFFWKKNSDRKSVKPYYKFRARVVAEDQVASRVLGVVHGCGFDIALAPNDKDMIGSVGALEDTFLYRDKAGQECLTPSLITLRESVYGTPKSVDGEIIRGVGRMYEGFGDTLDQDRLIAAMSKMGAETIWKMSHERAATLGKGRSHGWQAAHVILDAYNMAGSRGKLPEDGLAT